MREATKRHLDAATKLIAAHGITLKAEPWMKEDTKKIEAVAFKFLCSGKWIAIGEETDDLLLVHIKGDDVTVTLYAATGSRVLAPAAEPAGKNKGKKDDS